MKHCYLSGTDYEIGFQHGEACRDEIAASLATYAYMFESLAGFSWSDVREIADRELARLEPLLPGCCQEIRGIAAGSGVDLLDIFALNIRSEILFSLGRTEVADGCTSLAISASRADGSSLLLAQNWDWLASQRGACVVLTVKPGQGSAYLTVTEAGILAKVGFNAAGIGVCLNALSAGFRPDGIPVHFHLREVLRKGRLSAAMDQIVKQPHICAAHYLIASREGMAFGLEATPSQIAVLKPVDGALCHSNHLLHARHALLRDDTPKVMGASSYIRLDAIKRTLARPGPVGRDDIKTMLVSHDSHPEGVCQHPTGGDGIAGKVATVFSIVMDLEGGTADICFGNPCESRYLRFSLES